MGMGTSNGTRTTGGGSRYGTSDVRGCGVVFKIASFMIGSK
jgi:hypothetical protein